MTPGNGVPPVAYPQHGGYPPPPGYGHHQYPPPRKNNTGLIVGVTGIVLAAVMAVVLVLVLTGDDDDPPAAQNAGHTKDTAGDGTSSPEALAGLAVEVIETQDGDLIEEHACTAADARRMKTDLTRLDGLDASATLDDVRESGDRAQAVVEVSIGGEAEAVLTVDMETDGDTWCVSGIEITR